jgi:hypothetical protein
MSTFHNILELHEDLLKSRGYDEKGLNAPDKEGWYMKQLERQFAQAYRDAHLHNEPYEFDIKVAGFFNNDADLILFQFSYEYHPARIELNIQRLQATMNGEQLNIQLKNNKDLPLSAAVHKSFLKQDKRIAMAKAIAEHTVQKNGKRLLKLSR